MTPMPDPRVATIFVRRLMHRIFVGVELLLIRHALPVRRELDEGIADPELSPDGHAQAEHLARYLADERIDAIYASPLRRAHQTAEPLARQQELTIVTEDGVAEYDRGASWYVPVEELKASNDPRWQEMLDGTWHASLEIDPFEFRDTLCAAIERIVDRPPVAEGRDRLPRRRHQRLPEPHPRPRRPDGLLLPQLHVDPPRHGGAFGRAEHPDVERDRAPPRHRPAGRDQRLTAAAWRRPRVDMLVTDRMLVTHGWR